MTAGEDGSARWEGRREALRLTGTARRLGRGLELSGIVEDPRGTEGADHALTVRFALPMQLEGWRMDRDLERSWSFARGLTRSPASPVNWGRGACELWPVVAVAGKAATLGLGSRMDEPQTFSVTYDGPKQLLSIEADVALAAVSRKWPRKAPFRFLLLARNDDWGLRGCMEDYYQTYPALFSKRTELAGGWFAWGDILSIAAPARDVGRRVLHFRVDPGARVRQENADTPASDYHCSLTPSTSCPTNVPHEVRRVLSAERFLLEVDGKKQGEGAHDLDFTQTTLTLGVYTGHRGHGDIVWWDDLTVWPAPAP